MNNKIIVPVDFEQQSIIALDYAKYFADLTNAEIILFHVIEESGFLKKLLKNEDDRKKIRKDAYEQLEELKKEIGGNYNVSLKVDFGKVYDKVEDLADDIEPLFILMGKTENPSLKKIEDKKTPITELINQYAIADYAHLVVIMTRDENKIPQMFLGTNARELIQTSEIPVLSVKPWDRNKKKSNFNDFYDPFNILGK